MFKFKMSGKNLKNIINIFMIAVILLFLCMVCKKMSYKSNKELFNIGGQQLRVEDTITGTPQLNPGNDPTNTGVLQGSSVRQDILNYYNSVPQDRECLHNSDCGEGRCTERGSCVGGISIGYRTLNEICQQLPQLP